MLGGELVRRRGGMMMGIAAPAAGTAAALGSLGASAGAVEGGQGVADGGGGDAPAAHDDDGRGRSAVDVPREERRVEGRERGGERRGEARLERILGVDVARHGAETVKGGKERRERLRRAVRRAVLPAVAVEQAERGEVNRAFRVGRCVVPGDDPPRVRHREGEILPLLHLSAVRDAKRGVPERVGGALGGDVRVPPGVYHRRSRAAESGARREADGAPAPRPPRGDAWTIDRRRITDTNPGTSRLGRADSGARARVRALPREPRAPRVRPAPRSRPASAGRSRPARDRSRGDGPWGARGRRLASRGPRAEEEGLPAGATPQPDERTSQLTSQQFHRRSSRRRERDLPRRPMTGAHRRITLGHRKNASRAAVAVSRLQKTRRAPARPASPALPRAASRTPRSVASHPRDARRSPPRPRPEPRRSVRVRSTRSSPRPPADTDTVVRAREKVRRPESRPPRERARAGSRWPPRSRPRPRARRVARRPARSRVRAPPPRPRGGAPSRGHRRRPARARSDRRPRGARGGPSRGPPSTRVPRLDPGLA